MTLIFCLLTALFLPSAAPAGLTLTVQISGVEKRKGFLMAELKDETGKVVKQLKQDVKLSGTDLVFEDLKNGEYALAVFHDADANGKLNTNLVGIPSEAYGFSNDARGVFGPPGLSDQLFVLDGNKIISIKLN